MEFDVWLRKNHYRESTIKQTLFDLRRVGNVGTEDDVNIRSALRRYASYAAQYGIEDELTTVAGQRGIGGVKRLPHGKDMSRKLEAVSFEDHDWSELVNAVKDAKKPTDQVLWAMVTTGLRVGDVLRVLRGELGAILAGAPTIQVEVKGGLLRPVPVGVREPWEALARGVLTGKAKNVAEYVCPGAVGPDVRGSCAYHRINRRLKTLQRRLGLPGRANTHRIRRTIAVKTLEETDNVVKTQQMMGHRTMQSTLKYVDERNLRETARLQRRLAGLE